MTTEEKSLTVECPACDAAPGQHCTRADGTESFPHVARQLKAGKS